PGLVYTYQMHTHTLINVVSGPEDTPRAILIRAVEPRSEEHTSELQSRENLVCRLLLEKKKEFGDCFESGNMSSIGGTVTVMKDSLNIVFWNTPFYYPIFALPI